MRRLNSPSSSSRCSTAPAIGRRRSHGAIDCGRCIAPGPASAACRSPKSPGVGKDKDTPILTVSGFGAHRILSPEAGLHVFEPSEGATGRVTARVRLAARTARRRARRQGAQAHRRGARPSAADEHRRAALPRTAAAGARCRRQMAHAGVSISCWAANSICFRPARDRAQSLIAPNPSLLSLTVPIPADLSL